MFFGILFDNVEEIQSLSRLRAEQNSKTFPYLKERRDTSYLTFVTDISISWVYTNFCQHFHDIGWAHFIITSVGIFILLKLIPPSLPGHNSSEAVKTDKATG